jgi:DNA-directed RNA polymerase subunit N (RpoN/RPB10)
MLIPVLCTSCGDDIGSVAALFCHLRAERIRAALAAQGLDVTQMPQPLPDTALRIDFSDIFDSLQVVADCCRTDLATSLRFSEYY